MEGRRLRLKDKHMVDKASIIYSLLISLLSSLALLCSANAQAKMGNCNFFFFSPPNCITHERAGSNTEFGYVKGSENGPDNWAKLNPDWKACGDGKSQSPIELIMERAQVSPGLGNLAMSHKAAPAKVENNGHVIDVEWKEDAGNIDINGIKYSLKSCHWHSPAEHTLNGISFPLELHMVHSSSDGKKAVIGILYTYGTPDPFLAKLFPNGVTVKDGIVNPGDINFPSNGYYRYMGSLTTPPCTEGVTWTIIKEAGTVSGEQVRALKEAVNPEYQANARPIQQLDNRPVLLYT